MEKNSTTDSKKTLKSIICNVFTSGVTIIVSLISTVVITRIITVADLGIASSFNSLKSILTIIWIILDMIKKCSLEWMKRTDFRMF